MKITITTISLLLIFANYCVATPFTECDNTGFAGVYGCNKINMQSSLSFIEMGGSAQGADIWGWTDSLTNKEYALMGMTTGTAFVDISDPKNPVYLGKLPSAVANNTWRDIKTYNNFAFIVSEATNHGMQVFDLTQLRNISSPPVTFSATSNYTQFGEAHNIVINESSGFAYATGTDSCGAGLHMINIQNPLGITFAGCFSADGYTHDAQCINYQGPDADYTNKEICFNSNEDTLTIVDVTTKTAPVQVSSTGYPNSKYIHQGWIAEDHRYYLMGDELDESTFGNNTKTYIWDLLDLDAPVLIGSYTGPTAAIDHNLYIKGNYAYMANYTSGLRIVDITDISNGNLNEVAYFDTYPSNDGNNFNGVWSNYPYFNSGTIIVSDINTGLFILKPTLCLKSALECSIIQDTLFKSSFE